MSHHEGIMKLLYIRVSSPKHSLGDGFCATLHHPMVAGEKFSLFANVNV